MLGDADHRADAGVDCLVDRVGCEARRHEDQRRVGAGLLHRVGDRVEDGNTFDILARLAGRDTRDYLGSVVPVAQSVEASFATREALHHETRVVVDDDRH